MALEQNQGRLTYLNIKEGKLVYKDAKGEKQIADKISGTITGVEFAAEEYQGKTYIKAKITIVDNDDKFLLQMNVDSGYFRGFCNSLRNGNPTAKMKISPYYQVKEGKKQSTCFVEQDGKALKHFFTKDNPGDLPQVEKVTFKGEVHYDGTKQIEYWKAWLLSLKFEHELFTNTPEKSTPKVDIPAENDSFIEGMDHPDDMPF